MFVTVAIDLNVFKPHLICDTEKNNKIVGLNVVANRPYSEAPPKLGSCRFHSVKSRDCLANV